MTAYSNVRCSIKRFDFSIWLVLWYWVGLTLPYWVTRIEFLSIFTKTSQNCVSRYKNVLNSKHLFWKRIRTGNKLHTDRHRAAARWLPTTVLANLYRPEGSWPGLGKIDCNRYSISIFFTFCSSNALEPLLFWISIEYGFVFTFFSA